MRTWHATLFGGRPRIRRRLLPLVLAALGISLLLAPAAGARLALLRAPMGGGAEGPSRSAAARLTLSGGPRGTVWVTNQTLNTVAAYDARNGRLLGTFKVGAKPIGIVAPPRTQKVYVANESDDTISVIDKATGAASTIAVGDGPHHMVHSAGGGSIWFGEFNSNSIGTIATRSGRYRRLVASASPTAKTHAVWIGRGSRTVYAVNSEADSFTALRAASGTPRWFDLPVGDQPSEVLVTPNGRTAYLSIRGEDKIAVYDLAGRRPRKAAEVAVGDQPDTLQLTPDRRTLVVALRGTFPAPAGVAARVDLVDTRRLRVTNVWIPGATTTGHQWLSADGRWTFVAIESAAGAAVPPGVAVIDNRRAKVVATWAYPGGGRPHGVYFEPGRP